MSPSVAYAKTGELRTPWFHDLDDPRLGIRHDRDVDAPHTTRIASSTASAWLYGRRRASRTKTQLLAALEVN
jgi:hypothetical protein